jgi:hypothetical protein
MGDLPRRSPLKAHIRQWYSGLVASCLALHFLLFVFGWVNVSQPVEQNATPTSPATTTASQAKMENADELATILQSGSTNTRGYKVTIRKDGSATAEVAASGSGGQAARSQDSRGQDFPAGTIDAGHLRQLLAEINDVSTIPIGFCAKPASFGTRTQISYAGKTSGDLQCVRSNAPGEADTRSELYQELSAFVATTLRNLKVNSARSQP